MVVWQRLRTLHWHSSIEDMAPLTTLIAVFAAYHLPLARAHESLNGKVLTVAAEKWQPWFAISEDSGGGAANALYSGVSYKILQFLENALNFTSNIVRPPDGSWGSIDDQGRWGGMVGMVKRKEVDFGLGKSGLKRFLCIIAG